jgi:Cof subfamily protein (haloacid dehalogenase superfamily)
VSQIRLVVSDVDGTLVTSSKQLTPASIEAVRTLHAAGIGFAITSGRPPKGMAMLVEPLSITSPIGGFNGGLLVEPDMRVLSEHLLDASLVAPIEAVLNDHGLDVWVYRGIEWLLCDPDRPHVDREAATVAFEPTVVDRLDGIDDGVVKVVGVSDDATAIAAGTAAMRAAFGDRVAASTSQPYYLDVTHPDANKGQVVRDLASRLGVAPEEIAAIGDMPNDVLMFAHAGLSIAMGNADTGVQRAAKRVTASNDEDGFASAIERFVLGAG